MLLFCIVYISKHKWSHTVKVTVYVVKLYAAKYAELQQQEITGISYEDVSRLITRQELQRHCRHRTRGSEANSKVAPAVDWHTGWWGRLWHHGHASSGPCQDPGGMKGSQKDPEGI